MKKVWQHNFITYSGAILAIVVGCYQALADAGLLQGMGIYTTIFGIIVIGVRRAMSKHQKTIAQHTDALIQDLIANKQLLEKLKQDIATTKQDSLDLFDTVKTDVNNLKDDVEYKHQSVLSEMLGQASDLNGKINSNREEANCVLLAQETKLSRIEAETDDKIKSAMSHAITKNPADRMLPKA